MLNNYNKILKHVNILHKLIKYVYINGYESSVFNLLQQHMSKIKKLSKYDYVHMGVRDSLFDAIEASHWDIALLLLNQYKDAISGVTQSKSDFA